jgi:glycosyltransferase involved in cell wall biosynthesis
MEHLPNEQDHLPLELSPSNGPGLSLVIPVHNEGAVIRQTLEGIEAAVDVPHEILIVYDSEDDDTLVAIDPLLRDLPHLRKMRNRWGRGALGAIRTGLEAAEGDAIIVTMADLSDEPSAMVAMYEKFQEGYDIVSGSRYMPGGAQLGGPVLKSLLSRWAGRSLRLLTGIPTSDITTSFRLYRKSVIDGITVESDGGFEIAMELTVKAHFAGARVGEVPTTWRDRTHGESGFRLWRWLPKYLRWYGYALRRRFVGWRRG